MPYNQNEYLTQPKVYQKEQASKYKATGFAAVKNGNTQDMKSQLAQFNPVVIGIPVYPDFDTISSSNPVYDNMNGSLLIIRLSFLKSPPYSLKTNSASSSFLLSHAASLALSSYKYIIHFPQF